MREYKSLRPYVVENILRTESDNLIILESPHTSELKARHPAAGKSGVRISETLFCTNVPFGKLVANSDPLVAKFSVMNASRVPLQAKCYSDQSAKALIAPLDEARSANRALWFRENLLRIKKALQSEVGADLTKQFRKHLCRHISSSTCIRILVCGLFAQQIFNVAMMTHIQYGAAEFNPLCNKRIAVLFEYHPSELSGGNSSKWEEPKIRSRIQEFFRKELT